MALLAAGSPLVAGGFKEDQMLQTQKVRAVRGFYFDRKLVKVGTTIELPKVFAIEVCAANKAEPINSVSDEGPASRADSKGNKLV